jgi:PAS domain S-box-containing protein
LRIGVSASEASALFDVVGEGAPVGLAFLDTDLRYVRINAALAAINGRPAEEHIGRRVEEVLPELADVLVPIYRQVLETGEPILERELNTEWPGRGHVRHVLASWFPVRVEGELAGVGAVVIDITARKDAELRLEGVLQQLPVGVVIADAEGRVMLENRGLADMGLPTVDPGTPLENARPSARHADGRPLTEGQWPLTRSLRGETVRGAEIEITSGDEATRISEANSAPIRDSDGTIVAAVVVVQDVTQRRQAEQRQDLLVRAG